LPTKDDRVWVGQANPSFTLIRLSKSTRRHGAVVRQRFRQEPFSFQGGGRSSLGSTAASHVAALRRSSRRRRRRDRGGKLSRVRGQALIFSHRDPSSASEARIPKPPLLHQSPHRRAGDACALGKFVWRVVEAGGRRGSATMTALLAGGGMFVHRAASKSRDDPQLISQSHGAMRKCTHAYANIRMRNSR
jgi:hypothetical protein